MEKLMNTLDAAKFLNIKPDRLRDLAEYGRVPAQKNSRGWYQFKRSDLVAARCLVEQRKKRINREVYLPHMFSH